MLLNTYSAPNGPTAKYPSDMSIVPDLSQTVSFTDEEIGAQEEIGPTSAVSYFWPVESMQLTFGDYSSRHITILPEIVSVGINLYTIF